MDDKNTCKVCGKSFRTSWHLRRHIDGPRSCAPITPRASIPPEQLQDPELDKKRCRHCGRVYKSAAYRAQHEKKYCKQRGTEPAERAEHETQPAPHTVERLEAELSEMKEMMRRLLEERQAPQTITTGDIAAINQIQHQENNITNEVKVQVNVFGQEKVDHITAPQIYRLLMNAKGAADPGIQALLDTALVVFSDPEKPENMTCYLPNKKTSDVLVHEQSGWQIKPIETVLSPMVQRSLDVLFRKQPYGHEPGLPDQPDIISCGEVLKQVAALEADPALAR